MSCPFPADIIARFSYGAQLGAELIELANSLRALFDPCRPERHYMRGPDPNGIPNTGTQKPVQFRRQIFFTVLCAGSHSLDADGFIVHMPMSIMTS